MRFNLERIDAHRTTIAAGIGALVVIAAMLCAAAWHATSPPACDPARVVIGMPRSDLVARCPGYEELNVTQNYETISEQFVYPGGFYVYVENCVVTSMQWGTRP